MGQAERLSLQSDLAWVGQYNGAITGDVSERMVNAIKEFQKGRGAKPTGVLNSQERGLLADTARKKQESVGWKIITDPGTGVRLGIPTKLVPQQASDANGTKWTSPTGTIQIQLALRKEAGPVTAKLAEREKKEPGRRIDYTVVKPDFFVLSGLQGLKRFYLRGTFRGDEVRILTILYDQATENTVEPVVIAMSSAFNAFPAAVQIAGPPPRKTVEYGTGIVVSDDGAIIADRQITDGCLTVAIAGFGNADRVAEDKAHDLALLRIYGARDLKALNLANPATKTALDLTGIADPQNQGGGAAVTSVKASVAQLGGGSDIALTPAPAPGFSGALAQDGDGRFAGVALLKPVQVAGHQWRSRGAGGAGDGRNLARLPEEQRRRRGRRSRCKRRVVRDLRQEMTRVPDAVQPRRREASSVTLLRRAARSRISICMKMTGTQNSPATA